MTNQAYQAERMRLGALRNCRILDTPNEEPFDRIVRVARRGLRTPMAQISFVDRERQWLKAYEGLTLRQVARDDSFCAQAILSAEPLIVPDARADERFGGLPMVTGEPFVRSYCGVPFCAPAGPRIGAICVMDTATRAFSADEIAILQDLAHVVMDAMALRLVATTDSLTGALSRLAFVEALARDIADKQRRPRDLSCLLLDIDCFRAVNEAYGHAVGDRILREMALVLRSDLRADDRGVDYIGRLGGEEFAIVLPGVGRSAARDIGERLRDRVMETTFDVPDGTLSLTVSLGSASFKHGDCAEDMLRRADDALFAAKSTGRNRLVSDAAPALALVR